MLVFLSIISIFYWEWPSLVIKLMTSRLNCFVGRLSKKKQTLTTAGPHQASEPKAPPIWNGPNTGSLAPWVRKRGKKINLLILPFPAIISLLVSLRGFINKLKNVLQTLHNHKSYPIQNLNIFLGKPCCLSVQTTKYLKWLSKILF